MRNPSAAVTFHCQERFKMMKASYIPQAAEKSGYKYTGRPFGDSGTGASSSSSALSAHSFLVT